jgi:hypothetical protein
MTHSSLPLIELRPSRRLAQWMLLMHGTAAAVWLALPLSALLKTVGAALITASLMAVMHRHVTGRHRHFIQALALVDRSHVQVRDGESGWMMADVLGSSTVTPQLTVLNLQVAKAPQRRHVVLLPDSLAPEAYRQLRVWLRWGPPADRSQDR